MLLGGDVQHSYAYLTPVLCAGRNYTNGTLKSSRRWSRAWQTWFQKAGSRSVNSRFTSKLFAVLLEKLLSQHPGSSAECRWGALASAHDTFGAYKNNPKVILLYRCNSSSRGVLRCSA